MRALSPLRTFGATVVFLTEPAMRVARLVVIAAFLPARAAQAQAPAQFEDPSAKPAFAQDAPYRILLDQLAGTIVVQSAKGKVVDQWAPGSDRSVSPLARIPGNRPIVVEVLHANPLLYTYDVTATAVAQGDTRSCSTLGSRFASHELLASLSGLGGIPFQNPPLQPFPQNPQQMFPPPQPGTRGPAQLTTSFLTAAATQLAPRVAAYRGTVERLQALTDSFDESLATAAELGESLPLDSLLAALQQSLEQTVPGLRTAAQVPVAVRQMVAAPGSAVADLRVFGAAIRRGETAAEPDHPSTRQVLDLADAVARIDSALPPTARRLQGQLRRLELARQGTRQVFTLPASQHYRRINVVVKATDQFPDLLRIRPERQEIFTQPSATLLCQISIGVTFMDRTPGYASDNGVLVDRNASEERTAPSFMVHLAASRFPWVGALAGIGFGSNSRPDFYLGGTLRLLDPVLVNFGAVWQRGERLPDGLSLGDPVTDPAVFNDLPKRYYRGFFFGVSLGR